MIEDWKIIDHMLQRIIFNPNQHIDKYVAEIEADAGPDVARSYIYALQDEGCISIDDNFHCIPFSKKERLEKLYEELDNCCSDKDSIIYDNAALKMDRLFDNGKKDVLKQLVEDGPKEDGNIASKSARDILISWGLASRAIIKGSYGFTVANYRGGFIHNALKRADQIKKGEGDGGFKF